jgi:hypothetical protein
MQWKNDENNSNVVIAVKNLTSAKMPRRTSRIALRRGDLSLRATRLSKSISVCMFNA